MDLLVGGYTGANDGIQTGDIERIKELILPVLSSATEIYTDIKSLTPAGSTISRYLCSTKAESDLQKIIQTHKVKPLRPLLNELRVFKSESEVVNLRQAGRASGRAFTDSMRQDFTTEKDLSSFLQYQFQVNGCSGSAFVPVVGGGKVCDHTNLALSIYANPKKECSQHTLYSK